MNTPTLVILVGVILIGIAAIALTFFLRKRKTERLRTRFGPEYARAIEESGGRRGHAAISSTMQYCHPNQKSSGAKVKEILSQVFAA